MVISKGQGGPGWIDGSVSVAMITMSIVNNVHTCDELSVVCTSLNSTFSSHKVK